MGRPKGSIALKPGDVWSDKWPGYIRLADGRYRKPIKWRVDRCTNIYCIETNCSYCNAPTLQPVKRQREGRRPSCSIACKSNRIRREHLGNRSIKRLGVQQGHYVFIRHPTHPLATKAGLVHEHRLVVEKKIGRHLTKLERVHHIDFVKSNNSPENLFLCKNNDEHIAVHRSLNQCVAGILAGGRLIFDRKKKKYIVESVGTQSC